MNFLRCGNGIMVMWKTIPILGGCRRHSGVKHYSACNLFSRSLGEVEEEDMQGVNNFLNLG